MLRLLRTAPSAQAVRCSREDPILSVPLSVGYLFQRNVGMKNKVKTSNSRDWSFTTEGAKEPLVIDFRQQHAI